MLDPAEERIVADLGHTCSLRVARAMYDIMVLAPSQEVAAEIAVLVAGKALVIAAGALVAAKGQDFSRETFRGVAAELVEDIFASVAKAIPADYVRRQV